MARFLAAVALALGLALGPAAAADAGTTQPIEGDRVAGQTAAPVTVVVYLSPTCPHCAAWWLEDWPAFKAAYVDPGKARMIWRELPTPPQDLAAAAIMLARCAPEDRYETALQSLMSGQAAMRDGGDVNGWLVAAGQAGGLTPEAMQTCLESEPNAQSLISRIELARADGVRGTPSLLVNGELLADHTLAGLQAAVDARIAGAPPAASPAPPPAAAP